MKHEIREFRQVVLDWFARLEAQIDDRATEAPVLHEEVLGGLAVIQQGRPAPPVAHPSRRRRKRQD